MKIKSFASKKILSALFILTCISSQANQLNYEKSDQSLEGVSLAKNASLITGQNRIALNRLAAAVRKKKIVLFWAKVYVTQIFAAQPGTWDKSSSSNALDSLVKNKIIALELKFLRDVENDKIKESFREGLKANGLDPDQNKYTSFFTAIQKAGDLKEKQTWVVSMEMNPNEEILSIQNAQLETQRLKLSLGTTRDILSIWLGKAADSGLEEMQVELLK